MSGRSTKSSISIWRLALGARAGDVIRMVMRGDYRSLAMESLRAALDLPLANDGKHPKETFFLTLAAYLLDSNEGVSETVARSAFRAAAKDLLPELRRLMTTDDAREGMASFVERRAGNFTGR